MMDAACKPPVDLTDCSSCRDLCLGPIIFPCGHLICRKCVRQLIVREGLPAHCSSCHQIIPLVQGETISDTIDNMYKDLIVEKIVHECLRQDRKKSCDLCHETKVKHVCLDCRHYLCNTCSSVHSVSERSYGHKQQTLPTTWMTAEIQSQSDASGLEALCQSIQCCQITEETVVDTQTTRSEVEMILYDQICQLKNSEKDVDKLITSLQKVKVRLTIKQQILGMYAAELAKHDQSLVQTEPFLNRVRQIKKDNILPFPHLAALEGCIRALGHCGYMTSERPNTPHVNGDEASEVNVVEKMVEITLKKTERENKVTSQTTDKSPLTFKGVDCIKTASRNTLIKTDMGTVQMETIPITVFKHIMQAVKKIVVAKIDWSNDRVQKLESESRKMNAFEEKNKIKMMRLEKDIIRVTRQVEDERKSWTQRIEEERRRTKEQLAEREVKLRQLEDKRNTVIKQLEEKQSRLEEEKSSLILHLDEERTKREADLKVMNAKHKEEIKKERSKMKTFEEKNKTKVMQVEKDIIRVTRQLEFERRRWAQLIEEERSRAREQVEKMEIRFTQQEEEKKNVLIQLEEERSKLTLQLEEERRRLTLLLEEESKRREADLKVMNEKHKEETKQERKNVIRFVMRLEGRDRLLSDVLRRAEDGHLSQVVRQLLHDFHIRLLGVDCGLNFLMEVPASQWGEVVQEQLQGVLSDLVPEIDREEVTWSCITHLESSHDSDLRLGRTMLAPETATNQTSTDVQGQAYQQSVEKDWLQCVQKWYPHLHAQTYFLPPLHFNRVSYCVENIAGKQVLVPQIPQSNSARHGNYGNLTLPPVSDSDLRDDRALQRVLHGMRSLADNRQQKEVMFVVSQLQFDNYLGEPRFAPAAALLPRPSTLPEHFRQQHYDKGDFDVLIIHRQHGLFILEINSVGEDFGLGKMTEEHEDDLLTKEVEKVTKQLNKAEVVLRHLTSDLKAKINITKCLVMPNIKSSQLQRAIKRYPSAGQTLFPDLCNVNKLNDVKFILRHVEISSFVKQLFELSTAFGKRLVPCYSLSHATVVLLFKFDGIQTHVLCQCLGVQSVDAVNLCLLSDQLSDKQMSSEINKTFLQGLRLWWQHVVRASGTEPLMTSALYEQLLARFCGPATTVEVHSVTAPRLNIRKLGEAVFETGERVARLVLFPQQVDILNRSPPRAFLSGPPGTGKTKVLIMQGLTWLQRGHDVHVVSTWNESRAATTVIEHELQETAKTSTAKSRVHRHQFDFEKDGEVETAVRCLKSLSEGRQLYVIADEVVNDNRKSFTEFCDQLFVQVPGVFIWGASVYHDVRPLCLEEVKMTTPLRSPPVVVREVMESREIKNKEVHDYTVSDVPVPTDGPPVMRIKHRDGQSGHTGDRPLDCVECGHQVARVLTEMDVGRTGDSNSRPPLQYRDVLVLCDGYPTDYRVKSNGLKTTTASGLVRGLRDRHVPVRVVEFGDEAAIRDTALGVGDLVTVASWYDVQGLERKVVVVEKRIGVWFYFERLHAMSRCTSQLVVIDSCPV